MWTYVLVALFDKKYPSGRKERRSVMENAEKKQAFHHVPIMVTEVMDLLSPQRGGIFVDGTLGGGGHSEAILQLLPEGSRLIGIDRDETALCR